MEQAPGICLDNEHVLLDGGEPRGKEKDSRGVQGRLAVSISSLASCTGIICIYTDTLSLPSECARHGVDKTDPGRRNLMWDLEKEQW